MRVPTVSRSLLALVLVAGCADLSSPTTGPASRAAQNRKPMLLIFASKEGDARLAAQRREIGPLVPELERKGVIVVDIVGVDPLRDTYVVPYSGFHVILVDGQDGIRLRTDDVVPSEILGRELGRM